MGLRTALRFRPMRARLCANVPRAAAILHADDRAPSSAGLRSARGRHTTQVGLDFHIDLPLDVAQLGLLRRSLADWLLRAEVEPSASAAVILATHEAAANAMEHAHAAPSVTGSCDQDRVTVVVRNAGEWKESDGSEYRGRGLILMRGLMSQVDIGSGPGGSVVRMQLTLPATRIPMPSSSEPQEGSFLATGQHSTI